MLRNVTKGEHVESVSFLPYDDDVKSDESTRTTLTEGEEEEDEIEKVYKSNESSRKQLKVVMAQPGVVCLKEYGYSPAHSRTRSQDENNEIVPDKIVSDE